ncbi:MAG: osmotically inducible protein C [Desulfuromonadaceae bacterium GWC2_58_13]|nr:MAG: osmotically inducible protein C [Desulfuromonadaceae bacterium GWC2_58_13]
MKQRKVTFTNNEGIELAGLLDLPEDEQPLAWALFAHCFTCSKNIKAVASISRALVHRRIAVLRFDFTGIGDSGGDFSATTFSSEIEDLVAAADFMAREYQGPQILIGHSLGGTAVLQATGRIPSATAVVTIGALFDPAHVTRRMGDVQQEIATNGEAKVELGGRPYTLKKAFFDDLDRHDLGQTIGELKTALLVMHSPRDLIVAIDNAAKIYQFAKHPKSFISLDPADHLLSRKEDARYAGEMIAAWVRRYLDIAGEEGKRPEIIDNRVTARTGPDGFFTDLFVNGHPLVADEPISYGGTNRGPSPYDYLLAALGACTSMTVQMYARHKEWPLQDAVTRLRHAKIHAEDCEHCEDKTGKIDRFERELELIGDLTDEQRQRLLEIAEKCPVHRTLHSEVLVETVLREKNMEKP